MYTHNNDSTTNYNSWVNYFVVDCVIIPHTKRFYVFSNIGTHSLLPLIFWHYLFHGYLSLWRSSWTEEEGKGWCLISTRKSHPSRGESAVTATWPGSICGLTYIRRLPACWQCHIDSGHCLTVDSSWYQCRPDKLDLRVAVPHVHLKWIHLFTISFWTWMAFCGTNIASKWSNF